MKYKFHPDAQIEFSESVLYYSEKSPKLVIAFYTEIENVIYKITKNPTIFPTIEEDVCRCLTKRFPYGILYTIRGRLYFDTGGYAFQQRSILLEK